MPFPELVEKAGQKHVGLDPYWLAQACARVRDVRFLPRLIKPVGLDELRAFFEDQARRLMEGNPSPKEAAMKVLRCRDVGVNCDFVARGATVEEIMQKAAAHAKVDHGMAAIPPELAEKVKASIKDE